MNWLSLASTLALLALNDPALDQHPTPAPIPSRSVPIMADSPDPHDGDVPRPDTSENTDVLELANERYERMTVAVSIMGSEPLRFIVDTGAQATVISHELAERLQLHDRRTATLVGLNSERLVEVVAIPELSLGRRSFPVATAALVDPGYIGAADGILGIDTLQHQRVLLDFKNGNIAIADATSQGRSGFDIVVRARRRLGQLIIAQASIDGVRTAVIVDTGAQGSIGNTALNRRLRRARAGGLNHMTDINGIVQLGDVRIVGTLQISRIRLANLPITFADSPTFVTLGLDDEPALLLGMSELRLFNRVAIDFSTREVLFDLPPGIPWAGSSRPR